MKEASQEQSTTTQQTRLLGHLLHQAGYPRPLGGDAFRRPNFRQMADILYWLVRRFEPNTELRPNIAEEADRVAFVRGAVQLLGGRARILLDTLALYRADSGCLPQLLRLTELLPRDKLELERPGEFSFPAKFDRRRARELAREITDSGLRLHELLGREPHLANSRTRALSALDAALKAYEDTPATVERQARGLVEAHLEAQRQTEGYLKSLEGRERELLEKIRRRKADLERLEKKLRSSVAMKPPFAEEQMHLEAELERLFGLYLVKTRNLDFLEDACDKILHEEAQRQTELLRQLDKVELQMRSREEKMFDRPLARTSKQSLRPPPSALISEESPNEGD